MPDDLRIDAALRMDEDIAEGNDLPKRSPDLLRCEGVRLREAVERLAEDLEVPVPAAGSEEGGV